MDNIQAIIDHWIDRIEFFNDQEYLTKEKVLHELKRLKDAAKDEERKSFHSYELDEY